MINYKNYLNKGKIKIKLKGIKKIIDNSFMFCGCLSLSSLPDISKLEENNIRDMKEMFFIVLHYHI